MATHRGLGLRQTASLWATTSQNRSSSDRSRHAEPDWEPRLGRTPPETVGLGDFQQALGSTPVTALGSALGSATGRQQVMSDDERVATGSALGSQQVKSHEQRIALRSTPGRG